MLPKIPNPEYCDPCCTPTNIEATGLLPDYYDTRNRLSKFNLILKYMRIMYESIKEMKKLTKNLLQDSH